MSVHLADFPKADASLIDNGLENRMAVAQKLTSMVLSLRRKVNIKVRQPLSAIMVPVADKTAGNRVRSISDILLTEINVKELKIVGSEEGILVKKVKPDFKKLGPKFGKQMKAAAAAIAAMSQHEIAVLEQQGFTMLNLEGGEARLDACDVEIISEDIPGWLVANDGNLTVALDITVTDDLRREGFAREIVNRVQNIRKDRGYDITDRINLLFDSADDIQDVLDQFGNYIGGQVLAASLTIGTVDPENPDAETLDIDGKDVKVQISLN